MTGFALRGVSSTFAESLIVTNGSSAVARIAGRECKRSRARVHEIPLLDQALLIIGERSDAGRTLDHRHDNRALSRDKRVFARYVTAISW